MNQALGIILMGAPGAGKTTHSGMLKLRYDCEVLDAGQILREEVARGTSIGRRAAAYLERRLLVPDEVVNALVTERLAPLPADRHFVLDGFPRTLRQAEALDMLLDQLGRSVTAVFSLMVRTEDALHRIAARPAPRPAEEPAMVLHRLRVYDEITTPLLRYYANRGLLHVLSTDQALEAVHAEILQALDHVLIASEPMAALSSL